MKICLAPAVAERLKRFLQHGSSAIRSDHWVYYGKRNHVRIENDCAIVSAGGGFDSEYELNFRRPTLKERAGACLRRFRGRSDLYRYRDAYRALWSTQPERAHSPHQIIAQHYMRFLEKYPARSYLEIGAGTGYLAARVHQAWKASITIIDLPEILPFTFLYLHTRFPQVPFALPDEPGPGKFTFLTRGDDIADNSIDLAVNTASFAEMRKEAISNYFRMLRRAVKPAGLLFTVNREEKWMDGAPIRFADYPWSSRDQDLLSGPSALHQMTQPQNPMLMRLCRLARG